MWYCCQLIPSNLQPAWFPLLLESHSASALAGMSPDAALEPSRSESETWVVDFPVQLSVTVTLLGAHTTPLLPTSCIRS